MKKLPYALACALALFSSLTIYAQEPTPEMKGVLLKPKADEPIVLRQKDEFRSGFFKPFRGSFWTSSALYWGGTVADIASSQGKGFYEGNPRFRSSNGSLATGRAVAVAGGIYAVTVLLEKKWPMPMAVLRSIVGIGRVGVAYTNKHY